MPIGKGVYEPQLLLAGGTVEPSLNTIFGKSVLTGPFLLVAVRCRFSNLPRVKPGLATIATKHSQARRPWQHTRAACMATAALSSSTQLGTLVTPVANAITRVKGSLSTWSSSHFVWTLCKPVSLHWIMRLCKPLTEKIRPIPWPCDSKDGGPPKPCNRSAKSWDLHFPQRAHPRPRWWRESGIRGSNLLAQPFRTCKAGAWPSQTESPRCCCLAPTFLPLCFSQRSDPTQEMADLPLETWPENTQDYTSRHLSLYMCSLDSADTVICTSCLNTKFGETFIFSCSPSTCACRKSKVIWPLRKPSNSGCTRSPQAKSAAWEGARHVKRSLRRGC